MHIPVLISDLAVMLITGGLITIIFKKIKQPLVLGYILAGFLISSYFPFFPTVVDTESISTWSEIGIVFLMFHLGLEFNLHKLAKVGSTAIITTIVEVVGVTLIGVGIGQLLGFGMFNSICLGGMLSMSSTTIVIKAFDEMKLHQKPFAGLAIGTLIIQDIVGIFMMVILSTISVSKNISGGEVFGSLAVMILYLVVWLVLGIYFLPTFLNKAMKYVNDEMLIVISIGFCFGMVILANALGFSSALGAFLAGSLLAGTIHVERIEKLTKGIKDLFAGVFFLSVGMMVDPNALVKYAVPIVVITLGTLIGKVIFTSLGMLLSGQNINNSVSCGFSLAQIGEFAFIIASLGSSLGIISNYIYPIVVSVSVITTFTTPFFIKLSPRAVEAFTKHLPEAMLNKINKYTSDDQQEREKDNDWYLYIKSYFSRVLIFGGIMLCSSVAGIKLLAPLLVNLISPVGGKIVTCVCIYGVNALFVGPLMHWRSKIFTSLWLKRKSFRLPLLVLSAIKVAIIAAIAMIPLGSLFHIHPLWMILLVILIVRFTAVSNVLSTWYLQLQTRFLRNFNERLIVKEEAQGGKQSWIQDQIGIISFVVPKGADYCGQRMENLNWGRNFRVYIVKIRRGNHSYILPKSRGVLHEGDKVYVVGEKLSLENFYRLIQIEPGRKIRTVREFMDTDYPEIENALSICAIKVSGEEPFAGRPIRSGKFRQHWSCMILGVQKDGFPIVIPNPNLVISKGDILWVMGSNNNVGKMATQYLEDDLQIDSDMD